MSKWFGPKAKDIFESFAEEMGFEFIAGSTFKPFRVEARVKNWVVVLDIYTVHANNATIQYTRLRTKFNVGNDLLFHLNANGFFNRLFYGSSRVLTQDEHFDKVFFVRGSDPLLLSRLFEAEIIRKKIMIDPKMTLELKHHKPMFGRKDPEYVRLLTMQTLGVVKEKAKLREMLLTMAALLHQLQSIGVAQPSEVEVPVVE